MQWRGEARLTLSTPKSSPSFIHALLTPSLFLYTPHHVIHWSFVNMSVSSPPPPVPSFPPLTLLERIQLMWVFEGSQNRLIIWEFLHWPIKCLFSSASSAKINDIQFKLIKHRQMYTCKKLEPLTENSWLLTKKRKKTVDPSSFWFVTT